MSHPHNIDHGRMERCGHPEAVYAAGKTPDETCAIVQEMLRVRACALVTRMNEAHAVRLKDACAGKHDILWCPRKHTALIGTPPPVRATPKPVRIVCAGTSDRGVGAEAALTLRAIGISSHTIVDIGVAGIHRLLEKKDELRASSALIVCAGMEGALPSVVAGMVACPVIAVPTSVGYGVSEGGHAALNAMLSSCAAGIVVVNIDNGFGAACAVGRILST